MSSGSPLRDSTTGALLSTLDAGEAAQFARLARQLVDGNLPLTVNADNDTLTFDGAT